MLRQIVVRPAAERLEQAGVESEQEALAFGHSSPTLASDAAAAGAGRASGPSGSAHGSYEPGVQARVLTPIAFQALIVMIRLTSAPISASLNCSATAS